MATFTVTKDPNDVLDYLFYWSTWLASGETISTSTWTVDSGLTKDTDSKTDDTTTIWLSGGTAGTSYTVTNRITTSQGRTKDQSMQVSVVNQ